MTTTNTNAASTVKTTTRARYSALVKIAESIGMTFDRKAHPTNADCADLSAWIDAVNAPIIEVSGDDNENAIECERDAVEATAEANEIVMSAVSETDAKATTKEKEREEARAKFFGATKATKAHGYSLLAVATGDGDRRALIRAKLAELPESIRAGACKIAMTLVVSGGSFHDDLKALHDEQPKIATSSNAKAGRRKSDKLSGEVIVRKANGGEIIVRGSQLSTMIGVAFSVSSSMVDGKIQITLMQA